MSDELKRPKSKKWARRRKVVVYLMADGGWKKNVKISWDDYDALLAASKAQNETVEEFMVKAIERYITPC